MAEERARTEMEKFIKGKPLYEKLMEEYEQNRKQEVRRIVGQGKVGGATGEGSWMGSQARCSRACMKGGF